MATNNFNAQDISGAMFRPIHLKNNIPMTAQEEPNYKSAKVVPASSSSEEWVAPRATYPQVPMYDRWMDDYNTTKVLTNNITKNEDLIKHVAQVPMHERWMHDGVG